MVNRIVIGDWNGTGDYRIRASRIGYDVLTTPDPERIAFDSSWEDGLTVYRIGTASVPSFNTFDQYVQVSFGETLPVIPYVYCWKILSGTRVVSGGLNTDNTSYRPYPIYLSNTWIRFGPDLYDSGLSSPYTVGFMILRVSGNG